MKKILISLALLGSCATVLKAQDNNVQYKVTRDDPKDILNLWVYIDPFQIDAPLQNILGLSFNTGIHSVGLIHDRFGYDAQFRIGTLTMYKLTGGADRAMQLELGGMYKLGDRTATHQNTKVILDISKSTNSSGQEVETTKFIRIPAQRRKMTHVRGGLYLKKNPFVDDESDVEGDLTCVGLYAGISRMTVHNIWINTNTDGQASRSGILRFYADAIFCPVRTLRPIGGGEAMANPGQYLKSPFGFRVGFWGMPCEDRANKKKKAFMVGVEAGFRPGDGLYFSGSFMFPILRRKSAALGYKRPEGVNEKGQTIEKD